MKLFGYTDRIESFIKAFRNSLELPSYAANSQILCYSDISQLISNLDTRCNITQYPFYVFFQLPNKNNIFVKFRNVFKKSIKEIKPGIIVFTYNEILKYNLLLFS